MILDQAQLDDDVHGLLEKVSEVYTFMKEDGTLAEVPSMEALFRKLARQTLECADFIVHFLRYRVPVSQSRCITASIFNVVSLHREKNGQAHVRRHKRQGSELYQSSRQSHAAISTSGGS